MRSSLQKQMLHKCRIVDLDLIDYEKSYALQRKYMQEVFESGDQILMVCEHPVVLTLGRLATEDNILISKEEIMSKGVKVLNIDRGGEVTLHCPGQIVLYPILNLNNYKRNLKFYFNKLEQVAIDFFGEFDILACRRLGQRGVWVGVKKIASIGIGVKKWISFHGMSINVNPDLTLFSMIRPCGLDIAMTSIRQAVGESIDVNTNIAKKILTRIFFREFGLVNMEI